MRSMNILSRLFLHLLMVIVPCCAWGTPTDSTFNWSTLRDVRLGENWLNSENPAGLHAFGHGAESEIVLLGEGRYGGLKNYFSSIFTITSHLPTREVISAFASSSSHADCQGK